MRTLFSRLFKVLDQSQSNPYEDFLTEIFADLLNTEVLLKSFIHEFIWTCTDRFYKVSVDTQRTYPRLEGHDTESRPDMVIHFVDGEQPHLLFIESKLGSQEGHMQLSRYSDHLKTFKDAGYKIHLLYITKYHDPKDMNPLLGEEFAQIRWYKIYEWLQSHKSDFSDKVLEYMEEIGLSESRRFVPQDIYAIQNMQRLVNMMDSSIGGAVEDTMNSLFGKATSRYTERFNQLIRASRYMIYNDLGNYSALLVGFYLTDGEYPLVSIMLEVNPKYEKRSEYITAMKTFLSQHDDWEGVDLDDPTAWSHICCNVELLHFLSKTDHIEAIQEHLISKLNELVAMKEIAPKLGWRG